MKTDLNNILHSELSHDINILIDSIKTTCSNL